MACIEAEPSNSCRNIEKEVGVTKARVQTILKKFKFKPYKIKIVHHLHPGDAERRMLFCNWMLQQIQLNENFASRVIWSDEAYFSSDGIFNSHNTRHWSQENQHVFFERERQGRFGVSVACFILDRKIIFRMFQGGLTANKYLEILQSVFADLLDEVPLAQLNHIYFQQDGAPAHNSHQVKEFLENNFPGRWIGTNGPVRWPPRSPDLSILDFFLWGYLQNIIYKNRNQTREDLSEAIIQAFRHLQARPVGIVNALRRISKMCRYCVRENGGHFQQYL